MSDTNETPVEKNVDTEVHAENVTVNKPAETGESSSEGAEASDGE